MAHSFASPHPYNSATPPPPPPKPTSHPLHLGANDNPPNPPYASRTTPSHETYGSQASDGQAQRHYPPPPPPHPTSNNSSLYQPSQQNIPPEQWQQQQATAQAPQQPPQPTDDQPLIPEILRDKSKNDLQHALESPEILQALLHAPSVAPPSLEASLQPLQTLLNQNRELATQLLSLLASLETARSNTSARLVSLRALDNQWKKKQSELERQLEPWGPRELHQRLGVAIQEGEAMCRGIEESFIDSGDGGIKGERETGEWIKRVREGRKVVALRRERKARWDEGRVGGWR